MEKKVHIHISSMQSELGDTLITQIFDVLENNGPPSDTSIDGIKVETDEEPLKMEYTTEGVLKSEGGRVTVSYDESELTGMEGATTNISFDMSTPNLITMLRSGGVTTALVFEQGKRHVSIYETPFMPFEICIYTLSVKNSLLECGELSLDYVIEVKGSQAEHTKFKLEIKEQPRLINPIKEYE